MTEDVRFVTGWGGARLAYREFGAGRPVVLLHGLMLTSRSWVETGVAGALADAGYRVIAPDLRGHGDSARSHDPADYPPDVLADDGLALVAALGLSGYGLAGYSLGARVALRMLVRGARPDAAVLGGLGLDGVRQASDRTGGYRTAFTAVAEGRALPPGSPEARLAGWVTETGADPAALNLVLDTMVATELAELAAVPARTLVVIGDRDEPRASADRIAAALPDAEFRRIPGDHYTAMAGAGFGAAVAEFLA